MSRAKNYQYDESTIELRIPTIAEIHNGVTGCLEIHVTLDQSAKADNWIRFQSTSVKYPDSCDAPGDEHQKLIIETPDFYDEEEDYVSDKSDAIIQAYNHDLIPGYMTDLLKYFIARDSASNLYPESSALMFLRDFMQTYIECQYESFHQFVQIFVTGEVVLVMEVIV